MKKIVSIIITTVIIAAVVSCMFMPVAALEGTAKKYAPVIDGIKDEAYSHSYSFNIFDQYNCEKGNGFWSTQGDTETNLDANMYFLWDDKYFYVFIEVSNSIMVDAGADYVLGDNHPWESNCAEPRFIWIDIDDADGMVTLSVEAFHKRIFGQANNEDIWEQTIAAGTHYEVTRTDTGFNVEYAIAIPNMSEGMKIKTALQVNEHSDEGTLGVGLQMNGNNIDEATVVTLGPVLELAPPEAEIQAEVVQPAPANDAPIPEAPAAAETPAPAPAPAITTPKTGDTSIFMVLIAVTMACGVIVFAKKRTAR